jgi:PBP1b-binding outer membrane lipoprotein LpoB
MRTVLIVVISLVLTGCVQRPMTYRQWKAEQTKKARMNAIKREAEAMKETPVVFTKEEQAQNASPKR